MKIFFTIYRQMHTELLFEIFPIESNTNQYHRWRPASLLPASIEIISTSDQYRTTNVITRCSHRVCARWIKNDEAEWNGRTTHHTLSSWTETGKNEEGPAPPLGENVREDHHSTHETYCWDSKHNQHQTTTVRLSATRTEVDTETQSDMRTFPFSATNI